MHDPVKAIAEFVSPDLEISYITDEPGMGIYETNDKRCADKWFIDAWEPELLPDVLMELWESPDLIRSPVLHRALILSLDKVDDLEALAMEAQEKWEMSCHQYTYEPI